jgi:hypothetical protein
MRESLRVLPLQSLHADCWTDTLPLLFAAYESSIVYGELAT